MRAEALKIFNYVYWALCFLLLIVVVMRSFFIPFAHDEVASFYFYIQPGKFLPFLSHPDANGHFLTSALGWISFKILGSSPLSLRIPSILGFIILCYAVARMKNLFASINAKIILVAGFMLSFNFIGYYSLCRGYGLSMSFLILALYYFFDYRNNGRPTHFLKFLVFSQLALSANLTLVMFTVLATVVLIFFQVRNKVFMSIRNIFLLLVHSGLIYFWVRYAFYLQGEGALYYGDGDSYWNVTFATLIETILFRNRFLEIMVVVVFITMSVFWVRRLWLRNPDFLLTDNFALSYFLLVALIISFYLLKLVLHVNYPEDRTGLFFYVLFALSLAFLAEHFKPELQLVFYIFPVLLLSHFLMNLNFKVHPWRVYETFPQSFHARLLAEQERSGRTITVGGHRVREFIYGFLNYNSTVKLNHMTAPEALQMNADYAVAYAQDEPYYRPYYHEIESDDHWGFRLIKRNEPAQRKPLLEGSGLNAIGSHEYYNLIEVPDTTFNSVNPLLLEADFSFDSVPVPFNAWLVLQVDAASEEEENVFVRTPFNLVSYDWNGLSGHRIGILSGNIPLNIKRLVAYIWNIDGKEIHIRINNIRIYQLSGEGVTEESRAKI